MHSNYTSQNCSCLQLENTNFLANIISERKDYSLPLQDSISGLCISKTDFLHKHRQETLTETQQQKLPNIDEACVPRLPTSAMSSISGCVYPPKTPQKIGSKPIDFLLPLLHQRLCVPRDRVEKLVRNLSTQEVEKSSSKKLKLADPAAFSSHATFTLSSSSTRR